MIGETEEFGATITDGIEAQLCRRRASLSLRIISAHPRSMFCNHPCIASQGKVSWPQSLQQALFNPVHYKQTSRLCFSAFYFLFTKTHLNDLLPEYCSEPMSYTARTFDKTLAFERFDQGSRQLTCTVCRT